MSLVWLMLLLGNVNVVFFPKRGGRVYFATHPVTTGALAIEYAAKKRYLCQNDELAAVNVVIAGVRSLSKAS